MRFNSQQFDRDAARLMRSPELKRWNAETRLPDGKGVVVRTTERLKPYLAALPPPRELLLRLERLADRRDSQLKPDDGPSPFHHGAIPRLRAWFLVRAIACHTLSTEEDLCEALQRSRWVAELTEPLAEALLRRQPSNRALRTICRFAFRRQHAAIIRLLRQEPEIADLVCAYEALASLHGNAEPIWMHSSSDQAEDAPCYTHGKGSCHACFRSRDPVRQRFRKQVSEAIASYAGPNHGMLEAWRACFGQDETLARGILDRHPNEETLGTFLLHTNDPAEAVRPAQLVLGKEVVSNTTLHHLLHSDRYGECEAMRPLCEKAAGRLFRQRPDGDDLMAIARSKTLYAERAMARLKANWRSYFLHKGLHPSENRQLGLKHDEVHEQLRADQERYQRLWENDAQ